MSFVQSCEVLFLFSLICNGVLLPSGTRKMWLCDLTSQTPAFPSPSWSLPAPPQQRTCQFHHGAELLQPGLLPCQDSHAAGLSIPNSHCSSFSFSAGFGECVSLLWNLSGQSWDLRAVFFFFLTSAPGKMSSHPSS